MFSFDNSCLCRSLILVFAILLNLESISPVRADNTLTSSTEPAHISLKPYRVRIDITYAPDARLSPSNRTRIQHQLQQAIERSVGEKWKLTEILPSQPEPPSLIGIYESDWLPLPSQAGLHRLQPIEISKQYPDLSFDKLFLVLIESEGIGYRVSCREFDRLSRKLSPLLDANTFETSFLSATTFNLLSKVFSPVVAIEAVEGNQVTVSEQASQYLTPDPQIGTLEKGFYFTPFLRYLNRDREVKNIQFIPWTYLVLEEMNRKYATCTISSALRGILSGSRRRVETYAISVKPEFPYTNLSLIPRGSSTQSYAGMKVQLSFLDPKEVRQRQIAAKRLKEEKKLPQLPPPDYYLGEYLTNRSGTITLNADPKHPLIWLYIRSGKALVANVPYIPGVERNTSIQIPDDRIRLNVEGELEMLNGELIEAVAALSMQMSRIRKMAKRSEWTKVDEEIKKLESGISPNQIFQDKLNIIRVTAVKKAQQQKNRSAQSRIASLCSETSNRIDRFLNQTRILDLKTEIQDLKQLQKQASKR